MKPAQGPQLPYEVADRDAGSVLGLAADGEGGEHDGQARIAAAGGRPRASRVETERVLRAFKTAADAGDIAGLIGLVDRGRLCCQWRRQGDRRAQAGPGRWADCTSLDHCAAYVASLTRKE